MDMPSPSPQHEWLKQLVGHWTITGSCTMPDGSTGQANATESVRMLGDYFTVATLTGLMPGCDSTIESILTLGYDADKQRFVGSWIGSPMPKLVIYEGTLSEDQSTLTLDCECPSFEDPTQTAQYQDIIIIKSDTQREFHSQIRQPDGSWNRFMSSHYTRT